LGADFTDFFDDANLVRASIGKDNVKLGLLLNGRNSGTTTGSSGSDRSSGAHAPLLFEGFDEGGNFEDGQATQFFNDFVQVSHISVSVSPLSEASEGLRANAFAPARNH
jgi:hypothetical protein